MAAIPGNKVSRSLLVFLLSGLISQAIASDDGGSGNPIHWLERMNRSVLDLSYEGDFVYLNGKSLEAMRIRHQVRNGERCPPWRAKRRRVVPGSREATRDTRRAEGAKGDPKGASERGVQSYGRPVCSRNELAMLWRNAG